MVDTKSRIINKVNQLDDDSANIVLDWLMRHFAAPPFTNEWDMIAEEEPDETDLEMLREIERNPDCHIFMPESEIDARRKAKKKVI